MFTVSCYAVHPIFAKILSIWRFAQTVSDWLTFLLSICCCQCCAGLPPRSINSARDSVSCYKMLSSSHTVYMDIEEPDLNAIDRLHSDEELETRNYRLNNRDSITSGPSYCIDQACGEPRGQQLVLDFAPTAGDGEVELRSQVYDLESSHGSGSTNATSDSGAGLARAQGDHSRAQYRASHYAHGSDMEVEMKNHLPECDSGIPDGNHCLEPLARSNQVESTKQISGPLICLQPANVRPPVGNVQVAPEIEVKTVTYEENLAYEDDSKVVQKEGQRLLKTLPNVKDHRSSDANSNIPTVHNCKKIVDNGGCPESKVSSA